jgi:glycine betaine/proline transport system permease protein
MRESLSSNSASRDIVDHSIAEFVGSGASYYQGQFARMERQGIARSSFNMAACAAGPIWASARGLWWLFAASAVVEVISGILLAKGIWLSAGGGSPVNILWVAGGFLFLLGRAVQAQLANWVYYRSYIAWRMNPRACVGLRMDLLGIGTALVAFTYSLMIYRFSWPGAGGVLVVFPAHKEITAFLAGRIDALVTWMTVHFEALFTSMTKGVRHILNFLELVFVGTPWPVMYVVVLLLAWRVAGRRVALFTAMALGYLGLFGYWDDSMRTISLVGASTLICIVAGVPVGIWCAKSGRANAVIRPILDVMQTMPSFVYLVPAIAFFSIGKPPGVLATVVYALPIMIRLTSLGILQVPGHVKEAAVAFGASPTQLLFKVELPLSVPSLMTGINQTIMMCLSMSVIAALIGAGGLGDNILRALRYLETGNGILAGIAIALCAMILDRIVQGAPVQSK